MSPREPWIRSVLEATGVARLYPPDALREIVAHLDDAVDAKVRSGSEEGPALAEALQEVGDLKSLAARYPRGASGGALASGYLAAVVFVVLLILQTMYVVPGVVGAFHRAHVELPALTHVTVAISAWVARGWFVLLLAAAALGWAAWRYRSNRWVSFGVPLVGLVAGITTSLSAFSLLLPLISLMVGIGGGPATPR